MKKNNDNEMRNAFPVIKYDYNGKLISSNGTALPLLSQWNCRHGTKIPTNIMKAYPEMAYAMLDQTMADCCVTMGDCKVWFDIIPYPEAGFIGMYGYSVEMEESSPEVNTTKLRMAG